MNALETTILLAIVFESFEVLDVLTKYFSQHHGIVDLPILLLNFIHITTADDERNLSLAIVDSNDQIRAKCDFELKDMQSILKINFHRLELVKETKYLKVSTISKLNNKIPICLAYRKLVGIHK